MVQAKLLVIIAAVVTVTATGVYFAKAEFDHVTSEGVAVVEQAKLENFQAQVKREELKKKIAVKKKAEAQRQQQAQSSTYTTPSYNIPDLSGSSFNVQPPSYTMPNTDLNLPSAYQTTPPVITAPPKDNCHIALGC